MTMQESPLFNLDPIDPSHLTIGKPLVRTLVRADGCVLLRDGHVLRPSDVSLLQAHAREGIYAVSEGAGISTGTRPHRPSASDTLPMPPSRLEPRPVSDLIAGERLERSVYDEGGRLLLPAGSEISAALLDRLTARGAQSIFQLKDGTPEQPIPHRFQLLNPRIARALNLRASAVASEFVLPARHTPPRKQASLSQLREQTMMGVEMYRDILARMPDITFDLLRGRRRGLTAAFDVASQFAYLASIDRGVLPAIVSHGKRADDYLHGHGLNACLLAMNTVRTMGVSREQIIYMGMGALLQDVGMMYVPEELRMAPRQLTDYERQEVQNHPTYALSLLEKFEDVSETTLFVAYQCHERPNGKGYPQRKFSDSIHPFAKLAAVTDAYAAMTATRPHRHAREPYDAVVTILNGMSRGEFDSGAVRAFLDTVALFPVGSKVKLTNGEIARVIRANLDHYTRPTVVLLDRQGEESNDEIDLSSCLDLDILQPVSDAGRKSRPGTLVDSAA